MSKALLTHSKAVGASLTGVTVSLNVVESVAIPSETKTVIGIEPLQLVSGNKFKVSFSKYISTESFILDTKYDR